VFFLFQKIASTPTFVEKIKFMNALENPSEIVGSFNLNVELKELSTNGIVDFSSIDDKKNLHSLWNGEKLRIPVYGLYKISWGFYQNSITMVQTATM